MHRTHRILRNLGFLYASEIGAKVVLFLFYLLIVNHLGDVRYGQYAFAMAFVNIFTVSVDVGMVMYTTREIARRKTEYGRYFWHTLLWKPPLIALTFVLMGLALWILGYPQSTFHLVALAGVTMVLDNLNTLFRSFFQAFEKMEYMSIPRFLEKAVLLGVMVYLTTQGVGVVGIFYGIIAVYAVSLLVTIALTFTHLPFPAWERLRLSTFVQIFKKSIPFSLFSLFVLLYLQVDTVMISMFKGDAPVGWYNAAYQPIIVLYFVSGMLMTALYPVLSDYYSKAHRSLEEIFVQGMRFLSILSLPMAMGLMMISERLVPVLFGEAFEPSVGAMQLLAWVLVFGYFNCGLSTFLNAVDRAKTNLWTTGVGLVFNVIANFYFIPNYGITGAAITTLLTEILVFALAFFFVQKVVSLKRFVQASLMPLVLTAGMGLFLYRLPEDWPLALTIGLAILFYAAIGWLLQIVSPRDVRAFRSFLKRV